MNQHERDSKELRRLCAERDRLKEALKDADAGMMLFLEQRDQMRELLMRLVDLQNSGRGPIRSYALWNDVVNQARPLLGLEVRHV
jgi:hypothetical protein